MDVAAIQFSSSFYDALFVRALSDTDIGGGAPLASSSCNFVQDFGYGICFSIVFGLLLLLLLAVYEMIVFEIPTWHRYNTYGIHLQGTIVDRQCPDARSHYIIVVECDVDGQASRKKFTELISEHASFPRDFGYHDIGKTVKCIMLPGESPDSWKRHKDTGCGFVCTTVVMGVFWIPLLGWAAWNLCRTFVQHDCGWKLTLAWVLQCAIILTSPFWCRIICPGRYARLRRQLGAQYSRVVLSPEDENDNENAIEGADPSRLRNESGEGTHDESNADSSNAESAIELV